MSSELETPSRTTLLTRAAVALATAFVLALWPASAEAGGRAGGTTDSLRNKSARIPRPGAKPFELLPGGVPGKGLLIQGWHPMPVTLTPFCALTSNAAAAGCEDDRYDCGEVSVPCGPYAGGVELTTAGVGLRNYPTGTLELRGVRPGSQLVAAWLIWGVIIRDVSNEPDVLRDGKIVFEGASLVGTELGETDEPCWGPGLPPAGSEDPESGAGPAVFRAYQADVTPWLEDSINGDYELALHGGSLTGGEDPWGPVFPTLPGFQAEGASLVVITAHPDVLPEAMIALHAGPSFFTGVEEYHHELTLPIPELEGARHVRIGADGQSRTELDQVSTFSTWLSAEDGLFVALRGTKDAIDPRPDWQGVDGGPLTQLWDSQSTDAWASELLLHPDQTGYRVLYSTDEPEPGVVMRFECAVAMMHGLRVGNRF